MRERAATNKVRKDRPSCFREYGKVLALVPGRALSVKGGSIAGRSPALEW